MKKLAHMALVVDNYDRAIDYYTQVLGFTLVHDEVLSETKRWVLVSPGDGSCQLLLAKAASAVQEQAIGNQSGGRVFLFLHTDTFDEDYARLLSHQVEIVRAPEVMPYGKVLVFKDLYGNLWDLIGKEVIQN
ncbi:MAG: Lactoylglutathione lyase [Bacteroidota bacterium]|jgi:catechol 2,3-dioxygenase-like lactoylglutathione lyase family enzyme